MRTRTGELASAQLPLDYEMVRNSLRELTNPHPPSALKENFNGQAATQPRRW